jgi:hypothetical protein
MPRRSAHFIPLAKTHYTAIGRVATEWSELENYLMFVLRVLLDGDARGSRAVTANVNFLVACDIVKALVLLRAGETDEAKAFCKAISDLNNDSERGPSLRARRNAVVHGSWVPGPQRHRPAVVTHKARGRIKSKAQAFGAKEINALADEIADRLGELMELGKPATEAAYRWHRAKEQP